MLDSLYDMMLRCWGVMQMGCVTEEGVMFLASTVPNVKPRCLTRLEMLAVSEHRAWVALDEAAGTDHEDVFDRLHTFAYRQLWDAVSADPTIVRRGEAMHELQTWARLFASQVVDPIV